MKKRNSLVTIGVPSLFLIFSVLCMVIFSLLSLSTSRSDLSMSEQTLTQTTNYYNACNTATELCLEMEDQLLSNYANAENKNDFYRQLDFLQTDFPNLNVSVHWNAETKQVSFEIPFSDTQALSVTLNTFYPETETDSFLEIDSWKTIVIGDWDPDTKQNIFQGEHS